MLFEYYSGNLWSSSLIGHLLNLKDKIFLYQYDTHFPSIININFNIFIYIIIIVFKESEYYISYNLELDKNN